MTGFPPRVREWDDMLALATWLRNQRAQNDPDAVATRKMTRAEADARAANLAAVVALWQAITAREPMPRREIDWQTVADDLATIAKRAKSRKNRPVDQNCAMITSAEFSELCAALAWHHRIIPPSRSPHALIVHDINMQYRTNLRAALAMAA